MTFMCDDGTDNCLPSVILAGSANKSAYWKEEAQGMLFTAEEEEEEVGKEVEEEEEVEGKEDEGREEEEEDREEEEVEKEVEQGGDVRVSV